MNIGSFSDGEDKTESDNKNTEGMSIFRDESIVAASSRVVSSLAALSVVAYVML